MPNMVAILPLACLRGRLDRTGNPSLAPIQAPGREPGDCGNKRHPACHAVYAVLHIRVLRMHSLVAAA